MSNVEPIIGGELVSGKGINILNPKDSFEIHQFQSMIWIILDLE